jgi:hypothetical protein
VVSSLSITRPGSVIPSLISTSSLMQVLPSDGAYATTRNDEIGARRLGGEYGDG